MQTIQSKFGDATLTVYETGANKALVKSLDVKWIGNEMLVYTTTHPCVGEQSTIVVLAPFRISAHLDK